MDQIAFFTFPKIVAEHTPVGAFTCTAYRPATAPTESPLCNNHLSPARHVAAPSAAKATHRCRQISPINNAHNHSKGEENLVTEEKKKQENTQKRRGVFTENLGFKEQENREAKQGETQKSHHHPSSSSSHRWQLSLRTAPLSLSFHSHRLSLKGVATLSLLASSNEQPSLSSLHPPSAPPPCQDHHHSSSATVQ